MKKIGILTLLCCLGLPLVSRAVETRPPYSTIEIQVGTELRSVGDFVLKDKEGVPYAVGRLLVDFSSIYSIIAEGNQARGDCEYLYVVYKNNKKEGRGSVHMTRYFIGMGKSTIRMNTDAPEAEFLIDLDFDLKHEIATGVIRKGPGSPDQGSFMMRIRDIPSEAPTAKR